MPNGPGEGGASPRLKLFTILMTCRVNIKIDKHAPGRIAGPYDNEIGPIRAESPHV